MKALKVVALLVACYLGCLAAAVLGTFATLAITEKWGAGRTADALMTFLTILASLFVASALAAFLGMVLLKVTLAWRLLWTGVYLALLAGTLFIEALTCALLFNR
jgi:hypothetical protein